MENNRFDPNHPRIRRARLRRHSRKIFALAIIGTLTLIAAGITLLALQVALGWLLIGLSSPFLMLAVWSRIELRHIAAGPTNDINDLLSANVASIIYANRSQKTFRSLAEPLLMNTVSGRFLVVRFGLFPELLEFFASNIPQDPAKLFAKAREIGNQTDSAQISGAVLIVAIIASFPDHENLLRRYQLDFQDLLAGITWYNYLHDQAKAMKRRTRDGGIARDLNFGYIPTLQHFGYNISEHLSKTARSQINRTARKEVLDKMLQIFGSNNRQNVALIGPEGCGKSIIVEAFAASLQDDSLKLPSHLKYRQVFKLDASALISAAGEGRGRVEQLLAKLFNEAYAAKNIILYLNNAQLFFQDATGALDLTNLLQPIIEAGRLRIILSIEEHDFLKLSASNKGLANSLNRVFVQPTNEQDTMNVLEDQTPYFEARFHTVYDYRALKEAYRLGLRYVEDRAMPGRALRLLELGAEHADHGLVTARSIQAAVEKSLGVKIQVASSDGDRDKLLGLEELVHSRMIGQEAAVRAVSGALRRSAAGVRNEKRPIGTFLFLGPTGVGKTELAKSISEVYFNGETEIIRLDLNEFVGEHAVDRLIASADQDPMSLTAQIVKRPFSVVLLDEIEKAHPAVLTAFLQLLDEGILRDANNREISFRDAIIVATSNAGANHIRDYVSRGVPLDKVKDQILNELIQSHEFKPEFLNRFDEICIFEPLKPAELFQIVDLIVKTVNQTLAPQKITVVLDDTAKRLLTDRGYDPALGARPLRRLVQQSVENLVAKAILQGRATPGTTLRFSAPDLKTELGA